MFGVVDTVNNTLEDESFDSEIQYESSETTSKSGGSGSNTDRDEKSKS